MSENPIEPQGRISIQLDKESYTIAPSGRTTDVGTDSATPVSDDYGSKDSKFTGKMRWVQVDIDEAAEDLDHLITPEERFRVAMARQ